MSVSTAVNHSVNVTHTISRGLASPQSSPRIQVTESLQDGTGVGQADLVLHFKDTIASGGSKDYDLRGTNTDDFGNVVNIATLRVCVIRNVSTDPNSQVKVAPAATNGVTFLGAGGEVVLGPGAYLSLYWPKENAPSVTDTSDTLTITELSGTVSADVEVLFVGSSV